MITFTFSTSTDDTDFSTFNVARGSTGSYKTATSVPLSSKQKNDQINDTPMKTTCLIESPEKRHDLYKLV